jgi:hypothetical protein
MQLFDNPAISILGIYPSEIKTCPHRKWHKNAHGSVSHPRKQVKITSIPQPVNDKQYDILTQQNVIQLQKRMKCWQMLQHTWA